MCPLNTLNNTANSNGSLIIGVPVNAIIFKSLAFINILYISKPCELPPSIPLFNFDTKLCASSIIITFESKLPTFCNCSKLLLAL